MIEISADIDGFAAWVQTASDRKLEALRAIVRKADKQAMTEWVTRTASPGLDDRYSAGRSQRLGLTPRAESTINSKRKRYGSDTPYKSTRSGAHMRELIRAPGGHRVSSKNRSVDVETVLRLPGARVLNLPGRAGAKRSNATQYRAEFVGANRPQFAADAAWIHRRRAEIIRPLILKLMTRKRGRGAKFVAPKAGKGNRYRE